MQEDLISKKDLLSQMGISYGQLYRWKRQNLIPESWFIKQSTSTGQETFFIKEKILKRVAFILKNKEKYSFEEMAAILSPAFTDRIFLSADIKKMKASELEVLHIFEEKFSKKSFSFTEVLFLTVISKWKQKWNMNDQEIRDLVDSAKHWLPRLKNTSYRWLLCQRNQERFHFLEEQEVTIFLDAQTKMIDAVDLDEWAKELHEQLNEIQLEFEREV